MTDRVVDLVGKLLAQAEGTDNEHEAAAFVERAQQLATEHAVDLERARVRQRERRGPEAVLEQDRLEIGPRGRRGNRQHVLLYVAIAQSNDVLVNVAGDSTYLLGFGHRTDLEVVERLWTSLSVQMTVAAQRRMARGEHRSSGVAGLTWRLSYYDGFVASVARRLADARGRAVEQDARRRATEACASGTGASAESGSAELVLREKGERVRDFYARSSQARGTWRGSTSGRTTVSGHAFSSGRADGERADLGQPGVRQRGRLGA